MASIFGHAALALGMGGGLISKKGNSKILVLGVLSSMMPDLDVIAFRFRIPYESMFGHRGLSHSILFAALWAMLLAFLFFRKATKKQRNIAIVYIFFCTVSHGILDAMTTGGKGVGFFIPFDSHRYFFPWRFIKVSPLSISRFFSEWGMRVIKSELYYVVLPSIVLGVTLYFRSKLAQKNRTKLS